MASAGLSQPTAGSSAAPTGPLTSVSEVGCSLIVLEKYPLVSDDRETEAMGCTDLLCGDCILGYPPAVAEAVGELKNGEDQLALCRTSLLQTRLERHVLDLGCVGRRSRQEGDGTREIRLATPTMSGSGERVSESTSASTLVVRSCKGAASTDAKPDPPSS
jgi:hypothetical protein